MTQEFLPGLELSRLFYEQAVRPVLEDAFPTLTYSAARVGSGSEVLGFDTARSADHEWGPRLQLFVRADDLATTGASVSAALSERLPKSFLGWSTHFGPADAAIGAMEQTDGPVRHRVDVTSISAWSVEQLGFDASAEVNEFDWLATSGQRLAETVGGAVFHDGLGELHALRGRLRWYPDDVWRFVLAAAWQRLAQEEAFPGRCAEIGDELGARLVTARLVRDLVRLCLLMERRYVPYSKWLGSAFDELPCAAFLGPSLMQALAPPTWKEREEHLGLAYVAVAEQHNALGLTPQLNASTRAYYERPYQVIGADRFSSALQASISSAQIRDLPLVGSVDQFVDSTDVLSDPRRARAAARALLGDLRP
jgi:Domain of unknown function (DUF4037)